MPCIMRTKCILIGDVTVGKTALMQMFVSDGRTWSKTYNMTLGVDLGKKKIKIPDTDHSVEMLMFDSSGRDLYRDCLPRYWDTPHLLLVVYDVTSQNSLDSVEKWVILARQCLPEEEREQRLGVLFGNKCDLSDRRVVSPKAGQLVAEKLGLEYFEGSVKENECVEEPFFFWHTNGTKLLKIIRHKGHCWWVGVGGLKCTRSQGASVWARVKNFPLKTRLVM